MYGLPRDFDLTMLIGQRLEQVCFSENQVWLHFHPDLRIGIESSFSCRQPLSGANVSRMKVPVKESDLMHLLGARIVRASGTQEGTLSLTFENGHEVKVFDDSAEYESYGIATGAREIIV